MPDFPVFITGFMGSGKSTTARLLADYYKHLPLYDTDQLIEAQTGKTIASLFEVEGEAAFRSLEKDLLERTEFRTPCIVSTGGGMGAQEDTLSVMKECGLVIFLDAPFEILLERIKIDPRHRPLANSTQADQFLSELFKKRLPLYQRAHSTVNAANEPLIVLAECLKVIQTHQSLSG